MTDPIADMLTRIKNALAAGKAEVEVPYSKVKLAITKVLLEAGYITDVKVNEAKPFAKIVITLKYINETPAISHLKRESKPGCRIYVSSQSVPAVLNSYGINIISTSSGMMTGSQARAKNLGGELICTLW